jgi:hypothetical protein
VTGEPERGGEMERIGADLQNVVVFGERLDQRQFVLVSAPVGVEIAVVRALFRQPVNGGAVGCGDRFSHRT